MRKELQDLIWAIDFARKHSKIDCDSHIWDCVDYAIDEAKNAIKQQEKYNHLDPNYLSIWEKYFNMAHWQ